MEFQNNTLDINNLVSVLDINAKDNNSLKSDEQKFNFYKTLSKFGPFLLTIACNKEKKYQENISLNAAIQLKNFVNSNWRYTNDQKTNEMLCSENEQIIIINDDDKQFIRNGVLDGILYVVETENVKILKQLNQIIKKILKLDFKDRWNNSFIEAIKK